MRAIRICFFGALLIYHSSCQNIENENLNISLIDVFEVYPVLDTSGAVITPGQLQLTFEFSNKSDQNYFFRFDSWLKEKKDSMACYFTVTCENEDEMNLSLGYVTHPEVLLYNNTTDTVVLEADFRELHSFYDNCQKTRHIVDFDKITFHYHDLRSENKAIISNREFEYLKTIDKELKISP